MIYRQGDILLQKIDSLPAVKICKQSMEGEEIKDAIILSLGEATGHKHQLIKQDSKLVKSVNLDQFFLLVNSPSDLTHEEHTKITLPKGNYRVVRQRTYLPESIQYVAD